MRREASEAMGDAGGGALLSERAYDSLLDLLLAGELGPGTSLQERRLADRLGISRTPVREALARLEAEGLVTSRASRSPMVCRIAIQDVIEILKVRKLLEVEAAGIAAERGVDPVRLAAAVAAVSSLLAGDHPTPAAHWAVDDQVHGLVAEAAQNRLMSTMIRDLRRRTHIFDTRQIPERLAPGAAEHRALLDAVASGDAGLARLAMAQHLDHVRAAIVERIVAIRRSEEAA